MIGTTIAHYKITAKLGQGGMGAVYRATDTKLDREVAIKVLPESFAQDKERLARFDREAKALASLNHPNIAGIYGLEEADSVHALVLELVKGEDLSQRIKRGPLPVEEALEVCKQIAEALEAAHEKGIIHRDLKPANVKLTEDGKVKVLDLGLAKATATESSATSTTDSLSPTITADYTMPGTLLGTAAYMSPEQARGKPVDKRSDIWSFGCVLYECLTGKRMFKGEDTTETLAAIIKGEPEWSALPQDTPPTIHLLLRKCLAKDRKRRLHDIADARVDLEQAIADPGSSFIRLSDEALQETRGGNGIQLPVFVGAILGVALVAVGLTWFFKPIPDTPVPEPPPVRRITMDPGLEGNLSNGNGTAVRISPDGSTLAYLVHPDETEGIARLFLRRFDQEEAMELTAATSAVNFCFSPNGEWIAFRRAGGRVLEKASISAIDGATVELCEVQQGRGIDWGEDGWIVMGNDRGGIDRISESSVGGEAEPLTTPSGEQVTHRWPQSLPDGRGVLFTAHSDKKDEFDRAAIMVQKLENGKADGEAILIQRQGYAARYVRSGHLVYLHRGTLFAAAFDLESLTLTSQPTPVVERVAHQVHGVAHYDISNDGTLTYLKGGFVGRLYELDWVDRNGNRTSFMPAAEYISFKLSPSGNRLAYSIRDEGRTDIWIREIDRDAPIQFTTDPANDGYPVWSPSGGSIIFSRDDEDTSRLYWKRVDDSSEPRPLSGIQNNLTNRITAWSWHSNQLAISETGPTTQGVDLRVLTLEGNDEAGWKVVGNTNLISSQFDERTPVFSPDGRWLAYASNKSGGEGQIFVQSFPTGGGEKRVSMEGWRSGVPLWSVSGQELLFATVENRAIGKGQVFTTDYAVVDGTFLPGTPVSWNGGVSARVVSTPPLTSSSTHFDLHRDGERILVRSRTTAEETEDTFQRIAVFENFDEFLKLKIPTGGK